MTICSPASMNTEHIAGGDRATADMPREEPVRTAEPTEPGSEPRPPRARARTRWAWVRPLGAVGILAILVWQFGTDAFRYGVLAVDGSAVASALGIGAFSTLCCAWRWRRVAAGLGVRLPLGDAVAAYYRSQFLNTALPGGVIGDVHRAVRHGLDLGDVGLGVRTVVLDRLAGHAVQVSIALVVLFAFPSPVRSHMPVATVVVVTVGAVFVVVARRVVARRLVRGGSSRWIQALRAAGLAVRDGVLARGNWVGIGLASAAAVAGHLAMFMLAARTVGAAAPLSVLIPLMLLALLAMGLPVAVAGWGPREGIAAWAFAAAGLTAAQGIATAVTYGMLVLVASIPGAAVLGFGWVVARKPAGVSSVDPAAPGVAALGSGGIHG